MPGRPARPAPSLARRRGPAAAATLAAAAAVALAMLLPGAGGAVALAAPAADCPSPVAQDVAILSGEIVFVGTVVSVSNEARWASVAVEERWRGAGGLPDRVSVHGGPASGSSSPYDRTYEPGRWLFVVHAAPDYLFDDACTATQPWSIDLAGFRPPGVAPAPEKADGTPAPVVTLDLPVTQMALLGSLAIAVGSYLIVLRGRRRPPDWFR